MTDPACAAPAWANPATRYGRQEGLSRALPSSHHAFLQFDLNPSGGRLPPVLLKRWCERLCGETGELPGVYQGGQAAWHFLGTAERAATRKREKVEGGRSGRRSELTREVSDGNIASSFDH